MSFFCVSVVASAQPLAVFASAVKLHFRFFLFFHLTIKDGVANLRNLENASAVEEEDLSMDILQQPQGR